MNLKRPIKTEQPNTKKKERNVADGFAIADDRSGVADVAAGDAGAHFSSIPIYSTPTNV